MLALLTFFAKNQGQQNAFSAWAGEIPRLVGPPTDRSMNSHEHRAPTRRLPPCPGLSKLRTQAKDLLGQYHAGDAEAIGEIERFIGAATVNTFRHCDAQLVVARAHGFPSWPYLAAHVHSQNPPQPKASTRHYNDVFLAVQAGDGNQVMSMIDADESLLDITDANQRTPLTVAFAYKQLRIAKQLIDRGANVFAMNHSDRWGMRCIVEHGGLPAVEREQLVETAVAARVWDDELFHAVWRRDHDRVSLILANDPSQASIRLAVPNGANGFYNSLPYCGLTPLHYAVIAADAAMVGLLLEAGAEVDAVPHAHASDSRHTPMYLVPEGCGEIAELLVHHGANVKRSDLYLTEGSDTMRQVVVAHGAGGTPLMAALTVGDFDRAAKLIRNDSSVIHDRLPDARIDTPLHMAVKAGNTEIVNLLLDSGMDIDTPTSRGFTALGLAPEMYCSQEMIEFLVERGADVRSGNDSPLYAAIWQHAYGHWNYEAVIRYLVSKGSRPRGLCDCVRGGNLATVKLLMELGADVNKRDDSGFYDARGTNAGHSPLDCCMGTGEEPTHPAIAAFLRAHGARLATELTDN